MSSIITLQTAPITPVEKVKNVSDGKTYFVYNVSTNFDNWSQRNSKYVYQYKNYVTNWASFCNVHMMAMGLIYTGTYDKYKAEIDAKYPELTRFPDEDTIYLGSFIFK